MELPKQGEKEKRGLVFILAIVTVFLWASAFPAVKVSFQYYSAESIMLFRFLVASATLAVIAVFKKIRLPLKKDLPLFIAGGFIGIFLYMWLFNTGTKLVTAGISSFIIASSPVFTIVLSQVLLKEKVKLVCWIGVFVSFSGLVIITIGQTKEFSLNFGVLILLCAAIATSFHNIIQRKLLQTYTALEATTYSVFAATCFMLLFFPSLIKEFPKASMTANLIIVYLGIFPAAIAYFFWGYALSKAEKTTHVTVFLYLVPFMAALLAYLWISETLSLLSLIGGIIIILGMVMSNQLGKTKSLSTKNLEVENFD